VWKSLWATYKNYVNYRNLPGFLRGFHGVYVSSAGSSFVSVGPLTPGARSPIILATPRSDRYRDGAAGPRT